MPTSDNTTAPEHNGMSVSDAIDDLARVYQKRIDELQRDVYELQREVIAALQGSVAAVAARNAALQDRDAAVAARDEARRELAARDESCVLCNGEIIGFGNNPDPLSTTGICCDTCNSTRVIPARMAAWQ